MKSAYKQKPFFFFTRNAEGWRGISRKLPKCGCSPPLSSPVRSSSTAGLETGPSALRRVIIQRSACRLCSLPALCCGSVAQSCPTLCDPVGCSTPGCPVLYSLLKRAQTHVHCVSDAIHHLILCRPLLLLPSIFPSIRVFSSESALHITWPKDWSFSFSISPSNEYSGLISFRMDWLDLLAVQGTHKSLLQHHIKSINSSALSFLYGPALTSIRDYWKNHRFDYMDLC